MRWRNQNQQDILIHNIRCWGLTKDQFGFHYVCDEEKNKVRRWKIRGERLDKEGKLVAGGNGEGNHLNQLKYPNGIIVDDKGQIYVVDLFL
ncbi:unnamed protein product [Adineta ricciae]|uniref:Uncharacterized protein n=1 Tax=Adineta ricciae TaxID=249248 RepID=A0A815Z6Z4_ADIRI|nr:unnamed protein product [Adineta ricciae]CAF1580521.1 unnamed protein product [Adineta ricciae]